MRERHIPPHRPMVPQSSQVDRAFMLLLRDCWEDLPDDRPGFYQVRQRLAFVHGFDSQRSLVDSIMERLESFARKLEADVLIKTDEYEREKAKTDLILCQIYPRYKNLFRRSQSFIHVDIGFRTIMARLQAGTEVLPEVFDAASVCFTSISDFVSIVTHDSPLSVVSYLNDNFTMLDRVIEQYVGIFFRFLRFAVTLQLFLSSSRMSTKLKTISDSYMVTTL